jgi:hypothetical protein
MKYSFQEQVYPIGQRDFIEVHPSYNERS